MPNRTHALQQTTHTDCQALFNQLIGTQQEGFSDSAAEPFGGRNLARPLLDRDIRPPLLTQNARRQSRRLRSESGREPWFATVGIERWEASTPETRRRAGPRSPTLRGKCRRRILMLTNQVTGGISANLDLSAPRRCRRHSQVAGGSSPGGLGRKLGRSRWSLPDTRPIRRSVHSGRLFVSYTALDLGGHVGANPGGARRVWLVAAAITMGGGNGRCTSSACSPSSCRHRCPTTSRPGLPLLVAIFVTGAALRYQSPEHIVASPRSRWRLIGLGIAAMH